MTQSNVNVIKDLDVFLLGVKRSIGGTQTALYKNERVTFKDLVDNLRLQLATQEKPGQQGIPGMMFPDESLTYDRDSGRLGLNINSRGVVLKELMREHSLNPGYSDPLSPPLNSSVGDFYIVDATGIKLNKTWGISGSVLTVSTPGTGYQVNDGTVRSDEIVGKKLSYLIEYTIVKGKLNSAVVVVPSDSSPNYSQDFEINKTYTPVFTETLQGLPPKKVPEITCTYASTTEVTFEVSNPGEDIFLGPDATSNQPNDDRIFYGAELSPEGDYSKFHYADLLLSSDGGVEKVIDSDYQFGAEEGTKFQVRNGNETGKEICKIEVGGAEEKNVALNDKVILTKDGWDIIEDTASREAVFDISHKMDYTDISNPVEVTPSLHLDQIDLDGDGLRKGFELSIDEAEPGKSGLMPADFYDKLNSIPDTITEINNIYPELVPSIEQEIPGDDDELSYNILVRQEYLSGSPGPKDIYIKALETRLEEIREGGIGTDVVPQRIPGTTYIATFKDITDKLFPDVPSMYSCVPNAELLTTHYNLLESQEYTLTKNLKSVRITGENETDTDTDIDLSLEIVYTDGGSVTEIPLIEIKWYVNNVEDVNQKSSVYTLTPGTDEFLEVKCEVKQVDGDTLTALHYVVVPTNFTQP